MFEADERVNIPVSCPPYSIVYVTKLTARMGEKVHE
jgi:hypothetical protein